MKVACMNTDVLHKVNEICYFKSPALSSILTLNTALLKQ